MKTSGAEASRFAHIAGGGRLVEGRLQRNKKGTGPRTAVAIREARRGTATMALWS
jgi:hypothetical protein